MRKLFFPVLAFALIAVGAILSTDSLEAQYGGGGGGGGGFSFGGGGFVGGSGFGSGGGDNSGCMGGFSHSLESWHRNQSQILVVSAETEDELDAYLDKLLAKKSELPARQQTELETATLIKAALDRKITIEFDEIPLSDVLISIAGMLKINIVLDMAAIRDSGGDLDEKVTAHAEGITGRSALKNVLRNLEVPLRWQIRNEVILVSTVEELDANLETKLYDVTDLVITLNAKRELVLDYDTLEETLRQGCDENALWHDDDGEGGSISSFDALGIHALSVRQTQVIHDEIELLLKQIRRLRRKQDLVFRVVGQEAFQKSLDAYLDKLISEKPVLPGYYLAQQEFAAKVRETLSQTVEVEFADAPFSEAIDHLQNYLELPIVLDKAALEEVGFDLSHPVSFSLSGLKGSSLLKILLGNSNLPLVWVVQDEMLLITTEEEGDTILDAKLYDVADLVITRDENGKPAVEFDALKEAIKAGTDENSLWEEDDGAGGTLLPINSLGIQAIMIRQTQSVHDEIENILANLRKMRRANPAGLRFIRKKLPMPVNPYDPNQNPKQDEDCKDGKKSGNGKDSTKKRSMKGGGGGFF